MKSLKTVMAKLVISKSRGLLESADVESRKVLKPEMEIWKKSKCHINFTEIVE
jgi:hypothetical protein